MSEEWNEGKQSTALWGTLNSVVVTVQTIRV